MIYFFPTNIILINIAQIIDNDKRFKICYSGHRYGY